MERVIFFAMCLGIFFLFSGYYVFFGILVVIVLLFLWAEVIAWKNNHTKYKPDLPEEHKGKKTILDVLEAGGYTVKQEDEFYYAIIGEDYVRMGTWRYNVSMNDVVCIDVSHKVKSGTMLGLQEGMAREKEKYYEALAEKGRYNERKKNGFEGFVKMEEE